MSYTVQILDANLNYKATVRNLQVIDNKKTYLSFTKKLSDWGTCKFRVGTKDPLFVSEGDILTPLQYHVRVLRNGVKVWQGIIVSNPHRNRNYIDVEARSYLYLLDKLLITHDASVATGDGKDQYQTFSSGTLAAAVTTILNNAKAKVNSANALSQMTIGTIENPNFPPNFTDQNGAAVTGAFNFNSAYNTVQFSYMTPLYCLKALGVYSISDFEITDDLVFNWRVYMGNKQPNLVFTYGSPGQVLDYDIPQDGINLVNSILAEAATVDGVMFHTTKSDASSIATYGFSEGIAAYNDAKNQAVLDTRVTEELRLTASPTEEIHLVLNEQGIPLGQYGIGDSITIKIQDHIINVNAVRRVVSYEVDVKITGQEQILLVTNTLRDSQV